MHCKSCHGRNEAALQGTSLAKSSSDMDTRYGNAVREFANKSAASAASPDYVKFQAVIKSAASAASLCGGRASGRLDHGFFLQFIAKIVKISDSVLII